MKKGALHREWSLWHQLTLRNDIDNTTVNANAGDAATRINSAFSAVANNTNNINYKYCNARNSTEGNPILPPSYNYSPYPSFDKVNIDMDISDYKKTTPSTNKFKLNKFWKIISTVTLIFLTSNYIISNYGSSFSLMSSSCSMSNRNFKEFSLHNVQDYNDNLNDDEMIYHPLLLKPQPHEVFDIPFIPYSNISDPVYSSLLLNHTFALSWNRPAIATYSPPPSNLTYNRIILTLDTTVDGVQYDRLVHIYLNDNEIWRSSTIEPSGRLSHSFAQKDVTMYSSLFNKDGDLLIQLDNLITGKLTGAFHIELNALFFNDVEDKEEEEIDVSSLQNPFGKNLSSNPEIVALTTNNVADNVPPIVYYPDHDLSNIKLPSINFNTTQVLLLLTTSGNAAEEFWYSNLVDEYKDHFLYHNHHFYGHGSCRVINVFVNGIRVHSTNPKPYIFTGGVAPSLWNPIVSTGSFDLMPYHIDLTPILPLLWENPASLLSIEISNCIDDDEKTIVKSGIGSNWITSASLAIWEDSNIDESFGSLDFIDNLTDISSFAFAPPFSGMLTQVIKAGYENTLQTNLTYIFKNGTQKVDLKSYENKVNQTSLTFLTKFANDQSNLSILKSNSSKTTIDPLTLESNGTFSMLSADILSSKLKFLPPTPGAPVDDVTYDVNISVEFNVGAYADFAPLVEIKSKENGTAEFTISGSGNHGTGSMLHNYTLTAADGSSYERTALADNSTLIYDIITETAPLEEDSEFVFTLTDDDVSFQLALSSLGLTAEEIDLIEDNLE